MTMVMAHARWTDSSERKFGLRKMDDRVVDANAASGRSLQHTLDIFLVVTEVIKRERLRPRVHEIYSGIDRVDRDQRQNRSEYFFLHHREIGFRIDDKRRPQNALGAVAFG